MFKSIQWKIIAIFLLLTVSVMIVVGTFLLQNITAYYYNDFSNSLREQVFTPDVTKELADAASSDDAVDRMLELMKVYSIRMGIDSFRNYYILDDSLKVLGGSDNSVKSFGSAPNLLLALGGTPGEETDKSADIMDYAMPVMHGGKTEYIIYITDTKVEVNEIIGNMFINIFWALLFGMLISAIMGFFLSRTIIAPISTLQHRSESMAEGDFGHKIEVRSRDEIGRLTIAFNKMAARINMNMEEIKTEKNKVEAILLHMTDAVCAYDNNGRLIHINPAGEKLLGELRTESFDDLFERLGANISLYRILYIDPTETIERDIELNGKNLRAFFAPFTAERSLTAGVVVVLQDVTKSLQLDNARREFVANVSHELRTPITTIKSYAETIAEMEQDNAESPVLHFIKVIESEADRMTRLVKDLLTLSKLDSSKYNIQKEMFDLGALVRSVSEKLSVACSGTHEITVEENMESPDCYGERDAIEQVLTNIISNSIKYTPDGGKIDIKCVGNLKNAVITVRDNGIGIPAEDLPRVFERFYRVDKARSRQSGGTGLGLAIARDIVLRHGGSISIDSPHRNGTIVTVTLPLYNKGGEA